MPLSFLNALRWTGRKPRITAAIVVGLAVVIGVVAFPYTEQLEQQRYAVLYDYIADLDLTEPQQAMLVDVASDGRISDEENARVVDALVAQPLRDNGIADRQIRSVVDDVNQADADLARRLLIMSVIATLLVVVVLILLFHFTLKLLRTTFLRKSGLRA